MNSANPMQALPLPGPGEALARAGLTVARRSNNGVTAHPQYRSGDGSSPVESA